MKKIVKISIIFIQLDRFNNNNISTSLICNNNNNVNKYKAKFRIINKIL